MLENFNEELEKRNQRLSEANVRLREINKELEWLIKELRGERMREEMSQRIRAAMARKKAGN